MSKYKVRSGFYLHLGEKDVKEPGEIVELTSEQAEKFAHQIEKVTTKESKSNDQVQS